jgi:hypothetical protein
MHDKRGSQGADPVAYATGSLAAITWIVQGLIERCTAVCLLRGPLVHLAPSERPEHVLPHRLPLASSARQEALEPNARLPCHK